MQAENNTRRSRGGFTLVEAMVVALLLTVVVAGVYSAGSTLLRQVRRVNNVRSATTLLQQQLETLRGFDFSRIGIRSDSGVLFYRHTPTTNEQYSASHDLLMSRTARLSENVTAALVAYASPHDDPSDDLGADDRDGNPRDGLLVRVEISWTDLGRSHTRSMETLLYGIAGEVGEYDPIGVYPDPDPGDGDGDPGEIDILLAEFKLKDGELKVQATDDGKGANTLTLSGYGAMIYDKKKDVHTFQQKKVANPGDTVTVTSSAGGEDVMPVTFKK